MEAPCCIASLRSGGPQATRVTIWDSSKLVRLTPAEKEDMKRIIDEMGRLSAFAQKLKVPITDFERIRLCSQTLYLLTSSGPSKDLILVKGLLKVGQKNLFIRKECGALVEINPLCVLDFYVHFSCQRIGLGRQLFDAMLVHMKKLAYQIGYDRPSQKLLSFLAKHYGLKRFYPQANQFVIYNSYFDSSCPDDMRVQSRICDCIRGNQKSCAVALLDSPRAKEIYHGRRANRSPDRVPEFVPRPEPESESEIEPEMEPAPVPVSAKYNEGSSDDRVRDRPATPSIPLRRKSVLEDDEVKIVPSVTQIFTDYQGIDNHNHYDWMTGTKKPLVKPRSVSWRGVEFSSPKLASGGESVDRSKLKSGSDKEIMYESLRLGSVKSPGPEFRRSKSPKSSHRAQLSGFGAAAALGFNQR